MGSSLYTAERIVTLEKGESFSIEEYELTYVKPYSRREYIDPRADKTQENIKKDTIGATLAVKQNGKDGGYYTPKLVKYVYPEGTTLAKVRIRREFLRDLFLAFQGLNEDGTVTVQAKVNPLVSWLWVGCLILFVGAIWAILPLGKPQKERR